MLKFTKTIQPNQSIRKVHMYTFQFTDNCF